MVEVTETSPLLGPGEDVNTQDVSNAVKVGEHETAREKQRRTLRIVTRSNVVLSFVVFAVWTAIFFAVDYGHFQEHINQSVVSFIAAVVVRSLRGGL